MAKTKTKESKKAQPSKPIAAKAEAVTKSSKTKEVAKPAAKKLAKEELKKKKVVEPESSNSEEEEEEEDSSESDSDAGDSSDSESEQKITKKPAVNGKAKAKAAAAAADSDSDSDSESEEETVKKPVANGKAKAAATDSDSDSDSDSEEAAKPETNGTSKAAAADSSDSSDSSDSDDDKPAAKKDESDDSEDDSDDSVSETEEAAPSSKKRKAETEIDATPKKAKTDENAQAATTLFAGSLSWGINDDSLYEAFKDFEGLASARVVTDKLSGRSRGFGYVDFNDSESATKAYEAMQGKELDGRAINLDYANAKPTDANPQARAADRAKKHGDSVSPESDTLFVGNLPFDVDQDSVHQFFSDVREPTSVRLPTDPDSGNLKGFGYVSFTSVEDAKHVFQELNGAPIGTGRMSRNVRLDFASARPPREGGGGGFGGGFSGGRGRGGRGGGRGGDRGRGGRGRGGDRGRGGGRGGFSRGGGSSFSGSKISFD